MMRNGMRRRLRAALLGTAANGALGLMALQPAQAGPGACTTVGTTASCTGDQSGGIGAADFNQATVDTLNVNSLTTKITPATGTSGIDFERGSGDVTINSDMTRYSIAVTGTADGIHVSSLATGSWETGVLTINQAGDISSAGGFGIYAFTGGIFGTLGLNITSSGTITAYRDGINTGTHARFTGGDITIAHGGDISSSIGSGIFAVSYSAGITVKDVGNINAQGAGIYAEGNLGVRVESTGNIVAATGIMAGSQFSDITIAQNGSITATQYGLVAQTPTGASLTITHDGGDISSGGTGIFATSLDNSSITNHGNLVARDYGIIVSGGGDVTINSIGDMTVSNGSGMYIVSQRAISITNRGNIRAADHGIYATMLNVFGFVVAVDSIADITASGGAGIFAYSAVGYTTVTSRGNISAHDDGIHAEAGGDVTVNSIGNVTSLAASGIYAGGGGNVAVTVNGGAISGAWGVYLNGATNTLTIGATASVAGSLYAVIGNSGDHTVNNSGIVSGSVAFGAGSNAFNNLAGSVFNSGTTVDLGAGNVLSNSGTLAPSGVGTVGTTTLTGNFVQGAGAQFIVDVDPTAHTADRLNVSGTAGLAGKVVVDPLTRLATTTTYTIATAGTVNGSFSGVDFLIANSFARNARLSQVGNDVLLTLDPGLLSYSLPGNASVNQRNVAAGIDAPLIGGAVLPAGFTPLFALAGTPLLNALTQASGETATGSQQATFSAMNQFMGVLTDPFVAGRGDPRASGGTTGYAAEDSEALAYAGGRKGADKGAEREAYAAMSRKALLAQSFESRWNVWAAVFGGSQTTDGNATLGSNSATSRIAGTAAGADYWISPSTVAGFALAGGGTNFSVANGGTGRSDLFQAGAFIRHNAGAAYVTGALAYGWQDITTDRTVTIAGADHLQARFNANAWSGRLEGGYRFVVPSIGGAGVTPYAAAQFTRFDLPAYAEQAITGNSTFALGYGAKSVTDTRSELGLRTDKSFAMADGVATLRGRIAWAHDFNPDRSIGATFQALPGASFVVNGAAQAADAALVTASVEKTWLNGWSAAATFEGEFSNVTRSYAGKGVVRYAW
ncbi:autotransporter domain-containing protein [Bradyrhizobium sp. CIAT3101]|uniref:autotransporter outer membrane beta-barrel domain-containing protein n=1 Tax=Bradyrhizobium sp. CIAT3101 TaxID=439387 RepID=UPI0024B1BFA0|nr:autotransporter domain-containing protein [Bradyrhizobium sp. CIAT3101]WFU81284.1 autotransporter domain-containing protein [Bradyrhizobium sp. CIAT3101]